MKNSKFSYFLPAGFKWPVIILILLNSGCVGLPERLYYAAPTVIGQTVPQMKNPGLWIGLHKYPDQIILDSQQIAQFNLRVSKELKLVKDIAAVGPVYNGRELAAELKKQIQVLYRQALFTVCGKKAGCDFYKKIGEFSAIDRIDPEIVVRFGFITASCDQRILPIDEGLFAAVNDVDFDELQNSSLDIAAPLAILHKSVDGKWFYVLSALSDGWVKADKVVFCSRQQFQDFLSGESFSVVISPRADIFLDGQLSRYYDYLRMGSRVKIKGPVSGNAVRVIIPAASGSGDFLEKVVYMRKEDLNPGYLAYTSRNIINQAFKLLNAPYGWGGMSGEQDCSQFIKEIFATVGIYLPRNSSSQSLCGSGIAEFDKDSSPELKKKALERAASGTAILGLKGHIMLFLGMVNDQPYVIHALWAYRQKIGSVDVVRLVNRVAVTGLDLGFGSKKGSLLERVKNIRQITE